MNEEDCLNEYEDLKDLYTDFSMVIRTIIENILYTNDINYQVVTNRTKNDESLKRKVKEITDIHSVRDIDDLAGCRIIFYTNKDTQRIVGYLCEEFDVVKENLKYSEKSYNALHLVVRLKEDRLKLCEYEMFDGLKCEIQLTTVLFHAWSELAHDLIYKPKEDLSKFDEHAFDSIEARFRKTMGELKRVQTDFDYIIKQWKEIRKGKKIFSEEFLYDLESAGSINDIQQKLKLILEHVEKFGDKTPKELQIIEIINNALKKSKTLKKEPIKTLFGEHPGFDYSDVADVSLDIFDRLKYIYPKDVFDEIKCLSVDSEEKVKNKALDVSSKIVKYSFVPENEAIYYHIQSFVTEEIENWDDETLLRYFNLTVKVSDELLSPSFHTVLPSGYDKISLYQGPLPPNDTLIRIRERTICILKRLYTISETLSNKHKVLKTLKKATLTPNEEDYSPELKRVILDNTNDVISFYIYLVEDSDNEIIQIIEQQLNGFIKRFKDDLIYSDKLNEMISKNEDYKVHKVLVGWDINYFNDYQYEKAEIERKQKINEYVTQINEECINDWENKFLSILKNYNQVNSRSEYRYLRYFLENLGEQKPRIGFELALKIDFELGPFLDSLVTGIWKSPEKDLAKELLSRWIKEGKHLSTCPNVFSHTHETDLTLLSMCYEKAKEQKDIDVIIGIVICISINYDQNPDHKTIFINCIKELNKYGNYIWTNCFIHNDNSILRDIDKIDLDVLLENFKYAPRIDHDLELILSEFAHQYPGEIIDFFYERIKVQREKDGNDRYHAIPFSLHILNESLSKNPVKVIDEILKWFDIEDRLLCIEWANLIELIFPEFHPELEDKLIKLLRSKDDKIEIIVLCILRAYDGQKFLHEVCKEFIKQCPEKKEYQQEMFLILSGTVGGFGEYAICESYKKKRREIQEWKKDENIAIQKFAILYDRYLSSMINYEKKRVDESVEFMKREFETHG